MKLIKSILLTVCVLLGTACTLDLQDDPNSVQPTQTVPGLLLNSMQRNLAVLFNTSSTQGMQLTRLQNSGGSTYANIYNPQAFDGTWNTGYASILQDADVLIEQADREGLARHAGMARIISAYTLLLLVDTFGDVPYSEAFQGLDNLNPAVDDQSDLYYTTIIALLDKAEEDLITPATTASPAGYLNATAAAPEDLYYANNYTRWRRFANSIKLKLYLNLRLTDPTTAITGINDIIAAATAGTGAGFISAATDNFAFRYGVNATDPDARHPRFIATYPAGGGNYMSNWLMWHMYHGYNATHTISSGDVPGDPRMRFYFYRQVSSNSTDPNQIRCVTAGGVPAHYPQLSGSTVFYNPAAGAPPLGINVTSSSPAWTRTFCYPTNVGYWGRDYINNEGIPPDAFLRTLWGAYPAGGRFDANNPANVGAAQGMRGAGLQPIMMRSFVDFMLAEAALYLGITPPGAAPLNTAIGRFENGIRNSMNDVRSWTINGSFGFGTAAPTEAAVLTGNTAGVGINAFYTQAAFDADVNDYVTEALNSYNAQASNDDRMNYIAREYWIALFGNGVESYNLYRRTGMPTGMQPALNASPGTFPRSLWYPATFATLNSTVEQKADLSQRLFWDTNASNLDF